MQARKVWTVTCVVAATLIALAIVGPVDSAVITLKQLFKATARAKRQSVWCDSLGPSTNPCRQAGRTNYRFPCNDHYNMFIQCDVGDAMSLATCEEEAPYFDHTLLTCTPGPEVLYCHLGANPCTNENIRNMGIHRFACPSNHSAFLECDPETQGLVTLRHCLSHAVFSQASQRCVVAVIPHSTVHTTTRASLIQAFLPPCTQEAIESGSFFFPYNGDAHSYIECDSSGGVHIRTCEPDYYYNAVSQRCISAIVGLHLASRRNSSSKTCSMADGYRLRRSCSLLAPKENPKTEAPDEYPPKPDLRGIRTRSVHIQKHARQVKQHDV